MTLGPVEIHEGIPWTAETSYERWVSEDLGLPIHGGYFAGPFSSRDLEFVWWPRKGVFAAVFDLVGAESAGGMFVGEIEPGRSTARVRQLFEETIYIISGDGHVVIGEGEAVLEFGSAPGSLFAVPLNTPYQLHNTGDVPLRFVSVNTLPIMYNLLRHEDFIFDADWESGRLREVLPPGKAVLYHPDAGHQRTAVDLYDGIFVPQVTAVPRSPFVERAEGAECVYFEMAGSSLSAHALGINGGDFFKPHRHGPAGFVFPIQGSGYSLMWQEGEEHPLRFDWPTDQMSLIVPPSGWWHGHFVTSEKAVHLAVKFMSRKNPVNHLYDGVHKTVADGGTVLRYQDLDPDLRTRIWETYVKACAENGIQACEP